MPVEKIKIVEAGAMLLLLQVGRKTDEFVPNTDLKKLYGFELRTEVRNGLQKLGLVEVHKDKSRRVHLRVNNDVWSGKWLGYEVVMPARVLFLDLVVKSQIDILREGIADGRLTLSDLYPATVEETPGAAKEAGADLGSLIRKAYAGLAGAPGDEVSLRALRAELAQVGQADLDEALRALNREPGVRVYAEANQKTLTAADRAAAVSIGNQDKHVLTIR